MDLCKIWLQPSVRLSLFEWIWDRFHNFCKCECKGKCKCLRFCLLFQHINSFTFLKWFLVIAHRAKFERGDVILSLVTIATKANILIQYCWKENHMYYYSSIHFHLILDFFCPLLAFLLHSSSSKLVCLFCLVLSRSLITIQDMASFARKIF